MENISISKELKRYLNVFIGGVLLSLGVAFFLVPNHIVSGGTPGISILLNHFTGIQVGILMVCVNVPLVLLSIKFISKKFALRTIFAIFISAFMVDFIPQFINIDSLIINPILASIFGGIFVGSGLGFIIEGKASAGGPSVIASILATKFNLKQENIMIILDAIIVILSGFIFDSFESALLSLLSVYVSARAIDMVLSGRTVYKLVHISTKNVETLREDIVRILNIKGIIIEGLGLNSKKEKTLMMFVIESSRIIELKHIVQRSDKDAFMVVCDASELSGRGH